jgi:hypothetical protein
MSPPDYPSAWLRPRSAASVSPGRIIVAPRTTYGLNFRIRRDPGPIRCPYRLYCRPVPMSAGTRTRALRNLVGQILNNAAVTIRMVRAAEFDQRSGPNVLVQLDSVYSKLDNSWSIRPNSFAP